MTTIIYNCNYPETAFTPKQLTFLANTYQETDYTTDWEPCGDIPEKLIISEAPLEVIVDLFAEEDRISYQEILDTFDLNKIDPPTDIIIPANQLPRPDKEEFSVTECIHLLRSLIDHELIRDETPKHLKADLRCLQSIINTISKQWPFTPEDNNTNIAARQYRCTSAMRETVRDIMAIYQDTLEGKYHNKRAQDQKNVDAEEELHV